MAWWKLEATLLPQNLSTAMGEIREELGAEKVARQQLEERLSHFEQQNMGEQGKHAPHNFED